MATIINNPGERVDSGSGTGTGLILGIILAVVIALLLLLYGVPGLRGGAAPADNTPGTSIDVNLGGGSGAGNGAGEGINGQ